MMNYPLIHTDSATKFYSWDNLRLWLVREHSIARPEDAADLPGIAAGLGVVAYTPPVPPQPTLSEKQVAVWEQIKAERERRNENGVLVSGKWFHTDDKSRAQHLGMVIAGASLPAINWKTMDGTFIAMTSALATAVFNADFTLDITNFANAETHRLAMEALLDPTGYDFSTGWAPTYEVIP